MKRTKTLVRAFKVLVEISSLVCRSGSLKKAIIGTGVCDIIK